MIQQDLTEICDFSLLHRYECAHCMTLDDSDITPDHDYEVVAYFPSQFSGWCTIEDSHRIRKGDRVSKIRLADNPMVSIPGVACAMCTRDIPKAKGI